MKIIPLMLAGFIVLWMVKDDLASKSNLTAKSSEGLLTERCGNDKQCVKDVKRYYTTCSKQDPGTPNGLVVVTMCLMQKSGNDYSHLIQQN